MTVRGPGARQRSSSVQQVLQHVASPPPDHRLAAGQLRQIDPLPSPIPQTPQSASFKAPWKPERWEGSNRDFFDDLKTMHWMRHPESSFRMILVCVVAWLLYEAARRPLQLPVDNWFTPLFVISHPLPRQPGEDDFTYGKGYKDIAFLAFYIVVFSFIRQSLTEYIIKPYARWLGLKGTKEHRFVEQGYAVFYWGSSGMIGLFVMSRQPTWWYDTREFWRAYPHWRMEPLVKAYYLLQFSYWLQQMLLLVLRIEKPRSDFVELCIHHCVTLWLIGWSYVMNLTVIGTAIFVSMDLPDTFLGISKCINYTKYQRASEVSFVIFLGVWTYFRHWQNLRILYSVYYEYDIITPATSRRWSPTDEVYLADWVKWQVFCPIMLLQLLNLFWYYLIWRILVRMALTGAANDVREEGEEDEASGQDGGADVSKKNA